MFYVLTVEWWRCLRTVLENWKKLCGCCAVVNNTLRLRGSSVCALLAVYGMFASFAQNPWTHPHRHFFQRVAREGSLSLIGPRRSPDQNSGSRDWYSILAILQCGREGVHFFLWLTIKTATFMWWGQRAPCVCVSVSMLFYLNMTAHFFVTY